MNDTQGYLIIFAGVIGAVLLIVFAISGSGTFSFTNLIPSLDNSYLLGNSTFQWNNISYGGWLFGGGAVFRNSVDVNTQNLKNPMIEIDKGLTFYDDFLGQNLRPEWTWGTSDTGGISFIDGEDNGVIALTTSSTGASYTALQFGAPTRVLTVERNLTTQVRFYIPTYTSYQVGSQLYYDDNNRIRFLLTTQASPSGRCITISGGVQTLSTFAYTHDGNYHIMRIECYAFSGNATNMVKFYFDGVLEATHTTNVYSGKLTPYLSIQTATTAVRSVRIDYCYVHQLRFNADEQDVGGFGMLGTKQKYEELQEVKTPDNIPYSQWDKVNILPPKKFGEA